MYATYRMNEKELNNNFIKAIKQIFKDKDIEITISDDVKNI
jgi:hypothetical protein